VEQVANNKINFNDYYQRFYPLILLLIIFLPTFGALDNISARWAGISIINILFFVFNLNNIVYKSRLISLFTMLLLASASSIYFSINISESISSLSKIFIILISILAFTISFKNNNNFKKDFIVFLIIALFIEIIFTLVNYISIDEIKNFTGISMNRNISSFSILIKLPFLFYFKTITKNNNLKNLLILIEILLSISLILLESRLGILLLLALFFSRYIILLCEKAKGSLYYLFFVIICSISIIQYSVNFSSSLRQKLEVLNQISDDQSYINRVEFYSIGSKLLQNSPIIGNGIGSWKIESLDKSIRSFESNEASYYAHNDFLQFLAETGIVGFLIYFLIFLYTLRSILKIWRGDPIFKYIILSFSVILINSLFNFPFHRPQEVLLIFMFFSFVHMDNIKALQFNTRFLNLFIISVSVITFNLSLKEHKSLIAQRPLLTSYYSNSTDISSLQIKNIDYTYPPLASNLEPISSLISNYYINTQDLDKALELVNYGIDSNPHLDYSYKQKVIILLSMGKFNEASIIAQDLLVDNPNNYEYADITFSIYNLVKNEIGFLNIYQLIENSNESIHELYFNNYLDIISNDYQIAIKFLEKSLTRFPKNKYLEISLSSLKNNL
jgi:O-antigen ligase